MRSNFLLFAVLILFGLMSFASCLEEVETDPVLIVSASEISFVSEGGVDTITIECSDKWTINNSAYTWLQLSATNGDMGTVEVKLTVASPNATGAIRSAVLTVNSVNGQSRRVKVSQAYVLTVPSIYPSYNTSPQSPDETGMGSNAIALAAKMKLGWNIGNTLEAIGGENAWGNPNITKKYIEAVKNQGFNAIRLPCSWDQFSDQKTAKIKQEWIDRVKEVVSYCVDNDMFVLLNIHWDGGWLENNCTPAKRDSVGAKQKAYWEQIATAMREFDEHLMFGSANEPEVHDAQEMEVLHSYHQIFVNTVRATGGKNSYRVLVIQGPGTNIERSNELMSMPTDLVDGRLMAEVHYYTPSQFCFLNEDVSWGKMVYYWGEGYHSTIEPDRNATYGEEDDVDKSFSIARKKFVDKGIPVILGEYGAYRRNNNKHVPLDLETHNNSVDYWIKYVTKQAVANGLIPFWWDTGSAIDRANYQVKDQRTIDAINGATE